MEKSKQSSQALYSNITDQYFNFSGPKLYDTSIKVCAECLKNVNSDKKFCNLCDLPICNDECQVGHRHYTECQILRNFRNEFRGKNDLKQMAILPIRILATCDTSKLSYSIAKLFHESLDQSDVDENTVKFITRTTNAQESDAVWAVNVARKKTVETFDKQGVAFFPIFSMMNHSCSVNAKFLG